MLKINALPEGEPVSEDFSVCLDGKRAQAYRARVSAIPFNRVWPGHQRPLDQTETASFLSFSMDGGVNVEITAAKDFSDVTVRPLSRGIIPSVEGRKISFQLSHPGQYTVELDGFHHALHLFADPPEPSAGGRADPNIIRFGPGIHHAGLIEVRSGQRIILEGGAVVYGSIKGKGVSDVKISGYGILDNSLEQRDSKAAGCMRFTSSQHIEVSGITLRDSAVWTATIVCCDGVVFDNVKAVGMWRYNSDGIDLCNSHDCVVRNSFLRNFDDCIVIKGLTGEGGRSVEDILVKNCVLWCDWGRAMEIGAETVADEIKNIRFEDCDIIHSAHICMDVQNGDRAKIHDVAFYDIRAEYSRYALQPVLQETDEMTYHAGRAGEYLPYLFFAHVYHGFYSKDTAFGENYDISFTDIRVLSDDGLPFPPSVFEGHDVDHQTRDITIDGLTAGGVGKTSLCDANIRANEFTSGISIR